MYSPPDFKQTGFLQQADRLNLLFRVTVPVVDDTIARTAFWSALDTHMRERGLKFGNLVKDVAASFCFLTCRQAPGGNSSRAKIQKPDISHTPITFKDLETSASRYSTLPNEGTKARLLVFIGKSYPRMSVGF